MTMFMVESVDSLAWECDAMGARANGVRLNRLEDGMEAREVIGGRR
jgi:hypothetical protein